MLKTVLSRLQRPQDWQELALPIVLVLTGLILVCGDLTGILSLDRIQNYWPVAVIVVGLTDLMAEPTRNVPAREEHVREL